MERPQKGNTEVYKTLLTVSNNQFVNSNLCPTSFRSSSDTNDHISMDFIGPFEMTSTGNQYALPVICILTDYAMCICLADNSADTVASAYLKDICCRFGEVKKILSDNRS